MPFLHGFEFHVTFEKTRIAGSPIDSEELADQVNGFGAPRVVRLRVNKMPPRVTPAQREQNPTALSGHCFVGFVCVAHQGALEIAATISPVSSIANAGR